MAITYPVTFPTIGGKPIIEKMTMRLRDSQAYTESPFNFKQLVSTYDVARWEAEITIRPLSYYEGREFAAFLSSLHGREKTFLLANPLETIETNLTVTAGATSETGDVQLNVVNSSNSTALPVGKHIAIGGHIYILLEQVNGNSQAWVDIYPPLKSDVAVNTDIEISNPEGQWRLATDNFDFDVDRAANYKFTFSCIEAI